MALNKAQVAEVIAVANNLLIPWDLALGLVDKESAGKAFYAVGKDNLPAIRIEGHIFYRRLEAYDKKHGTKLLDKAISAGLAAKGVGTVKNSTTMAGRYAQFARMEEINKDIATESISIGIGQVMGFNHERSGHSSAVSMLQAATVSFREQVSQFLTFIASDPQLLAAAQAYDYEKMARLYNGSGWKKTNPNYVKDLRAFTANWSEGRETSPDWLARVNALGYPDIRAYQKEKGFKVDGIVGKITIGGIEADERAKLAQATKGNGKGVAAAGAGAAAAGGAVLVESGTVESIGQQIEQNKYIIDALQGAAGAGTTILVVVAVGLVAVGAFILIRNWQKKKAITDEGSS